MKIFTCNRAIDPKTTLIDVLKGMHKNEAWTEEISRYGAKIEVNNAATTKTAVFLFVVQLDLLQSYRPNGDRYCLNIDAILRSEWSVSFHQTAVRHVPKDGDH